jgi:F0F1-type ATP synthase membrane subunit c/vacuolar-type H+-ATPase subunit K
MVSDTNIDRVRAAALDRIEQSEKRVKWAFIVAGVIETLFVIAFLLLADFSNRVHILLLISAIATYTIIGCGLFALGAHVSKCVGRVLKAIETIDENPSVKKL